MRYLLNHYQEIVSKYQGEVPLTYFLKQYFRKYPKLGSRDRKMLSEMSYCYYRCARAIENETEILRQLYACLFLCNTEGNYSAKLLPDSWLMQKKMPFQKKIDFLEGEGIKVNIGKLILTEHELSDKLNKEEWLCSLLQQPNLFIRVRKQKSLILELLLKHGISFSEVSDQCISLPNGAPIDKILPAYAYVVQDASSQQTGTFFSNKHQVSWWDCCSGAGGKSLMVKDFFKNVKLTVSDKRKTILYNLKERFTLYGHTVENAFVLDMSDENEIERKISGRGFDNIICDVPCTGSGTWARTPEQAYFFNEEQLATLPNLQTRIATNAAKYLKAGGNLYYITCSVFKAENENVVARILENTNLHLVHSELINGIGKGADCLFVSVLRKG